ncbi:hypothetical protein [Brevundimonas lenta]|uniref:Uncharacterized protein n=1 Tax=Brevundimonas lenta TaxID=424796 RepID=A0A7W6NP12_9CAUL|nr:hypothetical protein [Brevundimonas lenta]MBB4081710.1 hypothetical protein [Brevundimonas lenta]
MLEEAQTRAGSAGDEPTTPDAVEIAMEAEATGAPPEGAARRLLESHIRLAEEQIGLARNERFRNRIKAVRDMTLAAAVMLLVLGAGAVLLAARNAQGLVVEPLGVPPEMAAQGMDGSVLAARLLDRLSAMQAATDSSRAPSSYSNNWGDDLAVEVPQTGMSAGELWGALRAGLGRETRLTGDVVRTADGLAITVRVGSQPGVTVSGPESDLNRLLDQSAEAAYRQSQPYRYAVWVSRRGNGMDAPVLAELAASTDRTERLWALVGQAVNALDANDPALGETLARQALELDPTFHKARWNVSDSLLAMGRDEDLLAENRLTERAMRRRDPRVTEASQGQVLHNVRSSIAEATGDFATAAAEATIMTGLPDYANNGVNAHYYAAEARLRLHDVSGARRARAPIDGTSRAIPQAALLIDFVEASERGDAAAVQRLGAEVIAMLGTP